MRVAILGYFDYQTGLATAARNTMAVLEARGVEVTRLHLHANSTSILPPVDVHPIDVCLFHANPSRPLVGPVLADAGWRPEDLAGFVSVCAPYYELPGVPYDFMPVLLGMDAVIAPTAFIEESLKRDLPTARVFYSPQTAFVPDTIVSDRERFGIPQDAVAFVTSLDIGSSVDRKNPRGTIEAFRRAFPDDEGVRLLVRAKDFSGGDLLSVLESDLRDFAQADPRVIFVRGVLEYDEVLSLYASADVYVSLHRSEGLGLGPMEAMALGRTVIATGWSGNMDFMTEENSLPVPYELVPVSVPENTPYWRSVPEEHSFWAEPDIDAAAAAMRAVRFDPALRQRLGERARTDIALRRERFERAEFISELTAMAKSEYLESAVHREHARTLGALVAEALTPPPASALVPRPLWRRALGKAKRLLLGLLRH